MKKLAANLYGRQNNPFLDNECTAIADLFFQLNRKSLDLSTKRHELHAIEKFIGLYFEHDCCAFLAVILICGLINCLLQ